MKVNCKHCERYQFTANTSTIVNSLICHGCKAKSNYSIMFYDATPEQLRHKSLEEETPPKKLKPPKDKEVDTV